MITTDKNQIQRDLYFSRDVEVCSEIEVFDIFNLKPQRLEELYKKCLAFSYKFECDRDGLHSETMFWSNAPEYPLLNLKRKKIRLLRLRKDMSVFEIKCLAEASFGDIKKFEDAFCSPVLLNSPNFILAGKNCGYLFERHSLKTFRDKRQVIERERYGNASFPIIFISKKPNNEIIERLTHIAWV